MQNPEDKGSVGAHGYWLASCTRREFMRRSLLLTGLALGGGAVAACTGRSTDPFSSSAAQTLESLADAAIPRGGGFEAGARDVDVVGRVEGVLAHSDPGVGTQFRGALTLVEWLPLVWFGRRFSSLSPEQRIQVLQRLSESSLAPLRQAAQGLHSAVLYAFYSSDIAWESIGYDGPWVGHTGGQP